MPDAKAVLAAVPAVPGGFTEDTSVSTSYIHHHALGLGRSRPEEGEMVARKLTAVVVTVHGQLVTVTVCSAELAV